MSTDLVVHVVDDDIAVRQSLAFLLATAGIPTRVHESALAFLEVAAEAGAGFVGGCIVTDIRMPGMDGLELQRQLKARGSTMPVVVITGHGDVPLAVQAMKEGAVDFIEKPFDDGAIIAAVRAALERRRHTIAERAASADILARIESLSARERQVLTGLIDGQPNKAIANALDISPRTVEIYRANLMTKMHATSLSELIRMALAAGMEPTASGTPGP